MQRIVDRQQPHWAGTAEDQRAALRPDAHHMIIAPFLQMIVGVECTDHAGERFDQRAFKPGIAFPGEQTILRHDLIRDHHVSRFATDPREGVAGAIGAIRQLQVGLNHIALAGLEFMLPLFPDCEDFATEFMADDNRIHRHVVRHLFMVFPLVGLLPGREAQAVGDHAGEDLVLLHFRECKGFQTQVAFTVKA